MPIENAKRDQNYVTTLTGVDMSTGLLPTKVYVDETTHRLLVSGIITSGLGIGAYDYTSQAQASTTDTWTFKLGGSGGTTIATVVITYTDSGKGTILTVEKT